MSLVSWPATLICKACHQKTGDGPGIEKASASGNTENYKTRKFRLFRCPSCRSINSVDSVDFQEIYSEYPVFQRKLDSFSRPAFRQLLKRLQKRGIRPEHRILDLGCGNGVFMEFLKERGFANAIGFDPYFRGFEQAPVGPFDWVIANDVIEHVDEPRRLLEDVRRWLRPGGFLYVGTACSEFVNMENIEPALMLLHQPFHRVILSKARFAELIQEAGFEILDVRKRSYLDTWVPFANYRFLDEFHRALGNDLDRAFEPPSGKLFLMNPHLFFYAFFGWLFPSADEPSILARLPG